MKFIKELVISIFIGLLVLLLLLILLIAIPAISAIRDWHADRLFQYPPAKWVCEEYNAWIVSGAEMGYGHNCVGQIVLDDETYEFYIGFGQARSAYFMLLEKDENQQNVRSGRELFHARDVSTPDELVLSKFYSETISADIFPASMKFVRVELTDEERELYNIASESDPETGTEFDAEANSPFSTQGDEDPNQAA